MSTPETDELVAALLQLRGTLETDDMRVDDSASDDAFRHGVLRRISVLPAPRRFRQRRITRRALAGLAAALLVVIPGPRMAVARWLGIGAVRVERDTTRTIAGLPAPIRDLDLGLPVTLDDAQRRMGRRVATVEGHSPAGVWIDAFGPVGSGSVVVHTVYTPSSISELIGGTAPSDGVLVSELGSGGNVFVSKKLLGAGTRMDFLTVRDRSAMWISGDPHEVLMGDADGHVEAVPVRLAGSVLLWADDVRTIRIEGLVDRDAAVAVLERLVP